LLRGAAIAQDCDVDRLRSYDEDQIWRGSGRATVAWFSLISKIANA